MLKNLFFIVLISLFISACGDKNAIIKETAQKCSFQILGYEKVGDRSSAIARLNDTEQLVQVPIESGTIPKMRLGKTINGKCMETITKAGKRTNFFDVEIPVAKFAGDIYYFMS